MLFETPLVDAAKTAGKMLGNRDGEDNMNSLTAATSFWDASQQSRVLKEGSEVESEERRIQETTDEDNDLLGSSLH